MLGQHDSSFGLLLPLPLCPPFRYELFEKASAVVFFVMATVIYAKLWSLYRFDGRDMRRRLLETLPAVVSASVMLCLMFLGLSYHNHKYQAYFWATFTR
jgi:multisubunit Na+/H+ antiporter MnhB subunit